MSGIKYKAWVDFVWADDDSQGKGLVPVGFFSVLGGADRVIDLNSTEDMHIASELEQARTHQNIVLFLPATEGLAVTKFGEAFSLKKELNFGFYVSARKRETWLKALVLSSFSAKVMNQPSSTVRNKPLLVIEISLPKCELEYRSPNGKDVLTTKW